MNPKNKQLPAGPHISSAFDEDLMLVQAKISEMGGIAEEQLSNALDALQNRDGDLAAKVIARDKRLNELESEVEEMSIRLIALRQPVAIDLRVVIASLKISNTLERIGDLAVNVARRVELLIAGRPGRSTQSLIRMGAQTLDQLTNVLDAHVSRDPELALSIWQRDQDLDEVYNAIFREIVSYMIEDPRVVGHGSQLLFIAKNLERIGDHTTHIADAVYYICEGEPLPDDRPKGGPVGLGID
ncbi:phosphate signaling complex protein PhoU [Paracoccaceae bacterium GXU_MW_L88]